MLVLCHVLIMLTPALYFVTFCLVNVITFSYTVLLIYFTIGTYIFALCCRSVCQRFVNIIKQFHVKGFSCSEYNGKFDVFTVIVEQIEHFQHFLTSVKYIIDISSVRFKFIWCYYFIFHHRHKNVTRSADTGPTIVQPSVCL